MRQHLQRSYNASASAVQVVMRLHLQRSTTFFRSVLQSNAAEIVMKLRAHIM